MKSTAILAASLAAVIAQSAGAQWVVDGHLAFANPGEQVVVGISFDYTQGCHEAQLIVFGNADITTLGLIVDETNYGSVDAYDAGNGLMMATAGPGALRGLKYGKRAGVITDQGSLVVGLEGSAAALNAAYAGCLAEVDRSIAEMLKPLQPSPVGAVRF